MKTKLGMIFLATAMFLVGCSPRITGTWEVSRYQTKNPGEQDVVLQNIGTMTFKRNGSGEKELNYTVLGISRNDNLGFKWSQDSNEYITIDSRGSELSKTWIIIENKRKSQKWKSTDGANKVQVLELSK